MHLKCLQFWLARFVAAHQWQIQRYYVTGVITGITCTVSRRHLNKYMLVSGVALSAKSLECTLLSTISLSVYNKWSIEFRMRQDRVSVAPERRHAV